MPLGGSPVSVCVATMTVSVLDLFTIGIGPSSSHAVGPMRAAHRFVAELQTTGGLDQVVRLRVELYGSLAWTGKGHGTDRAVIMGLAGKEPDTVDPATIHAFVDRVATERRLLLDGRHAVTFDPSLDVVFDRQTTLPQHPNALKITAWNETDQVVAEHAYFSVGGGFIVRDDEWGEAREEVTTVPFPFRTGSEMLSMADESGLSISEMMWANECSRHEASHVRAELLRRWQVMQECAQRGFATEGILPGGLKLPRRAPDLYAKLQRHDVHRDPLVALDWLDVVALAVSEENAAGGRVVTAPTNGAAGILPAIIHYYVRYHRGDDDGVIRCFLVAGAIAILFKENASLSGAEVGCQGEVGVACSMAAAALTEVLGGSIRQVEQAAEIGMEHNLGLTCDPIGGLVQVPCIERNAMGAVKALNAARLALRGTGEHRVSLDRVIDTMRRTGADMSSKYKETSRGGLAVSVPEC